ncbi:MAG TPA: ABC transporter permease [Candidatus Pelethocola excrementipullorum]|nr:ABC transporter permease [Candidatus Pelethocola excrementipullorum]
MAKGFLKYVIIVLAVIFFFVSFSKSIYQFKELKYLEENITYIYNKTESFEAHTDQMQTLPINCEIWGISQNVEIQPARPGHSVKGYVVYAAGNRILDMYLGMDKSACVLSSQLAISLFGTKNVTGEKILYEGEEYIVKGVITEVNHILFLNPPDRDEKLSQVNNGIAMVREIGMLNYMSAENLFQDRDEKIDVDFMKWIIQLIMYIYLTWILLLIIKLIRFYGKKQWSYTIGAAAILWMLFFKIFVFQTYAFPIRILPVKWSDFEGWGEVIDSVYRYFSNIIRYKDLPVITGYYQGIYGCLYQMIFTMVFLKLALYWCRRLGSCLQR